MIFIDENEVGVKYSGEELSKKFSVPQENLETPLIANLPMQFEEE